MQSYYCQSVNEDTSTKSAPITSDGTAPTADKWASSLPPVSFSGSAGFSVGHEQEYKEESGIYMIAMSSDTQSQATLLASKTVASIAPAPGAPQKAPKRLIFQLDDQQQHRDTFDLEEKVYQSNFYFYYT